jgi:hypothetical protein
MEPEFVPSGLNRKNRIARTKSLSPSYRQTPKAGDRNTVALLVSDAVPPVLNIVNLERFSRTVPEQLLI